MRIKAVFKVVGPAILVIGLAMIACTGISFIYGNNPIPLLAGGISSAAFGTLCMLACRGADMDAVGMKEGCAVATFTWLFACLFGAIPFYLMGSYGSPTTLTWTQSFYEIMSGFTTTGASILADVEILPKDIIFWRSLTHWFGGMGIVVLAVAILPKLGVGGMQAFRWESPGPLKADKIVPRIQDTAKILYTTYLGVTVVEFILLLLVGVSAFDSAAYTFGTVGTGGFGIHNNSIAGLDNPAAEWIIGFFMWLCGMNFGLIYFAFVKGRIKDFFRDTEWKAYMALSLGTAAIVTFLITGYKGWSVLEAARYAFFQMATVLTTTGYATDDYNVWPLAAIAFLLPLMFVGGSTGSTGGGPKVMRHVVTLKFLKHEILKLSRPNLVTTVKLGSRPLELSIVGSVVALLAVYVLIFFLSGVALTAMGHDLVTAFTASIANLGNIGPGFNVVGPAGNYSTFSAPALWILTAEMLLGRLEVFTVLMLLIPSTWMRR
jgi:trk system potassium uptake protein